MFNINQKVQLSDKPREDFNGTLENSLNRVSTTSRHVQISIALYSSCIHHMCSPRRLDAAANWITCVCRTSPLWLSGCLFHIAERWNAFHSRLAGGSRNTLSFCLSNLFQGFTCMIKPVQVTELDAIIKAWIWSNSSNYRNFSFLCLLWMPSTGRSNAERQCHISRCRLTTGRLNPPPPPPHTHTQTHTFANARTSGYITKKVTRNQ